MGQQWDSTRDPGESSSTTIDSSSPAASSRSTPLQSARRWFAAAIGSSKGEYAPLINRGKGVLELPRQTVRKVVVSVTFLVVGFFALGTLLIYMLFYTSHRADDPPIIDAERLMKDIPSAANIKAYLHYYTSRPHLAGSQGDKLQAEWTRDQFQEFGISNTTIETYYPLLNYPLKRRLAIVSGPSEFWYEAKLSESVVDQNETSGGERQSAMEASTFHGYSKNGTATAPVVYAHYGRVQDFEYLTSQGIHMNGSIALMRASMDGAATFSIGHSVHAAQAFGCVGALIYTDPMDDGPVNKSGYPHVSPARPYPEGPWRSPGSVARGSVQFTPLLAGDPTTPGWASTRGAQRIPRDQSNGVPVIPSLPISYEDALPLLRATEHRGACRNNWQGGSEDVVYCTGPSEGDVQLVNIIEDRYTPIWNVIGRIPGREEPDRAVILGNHRDAWVYGAADPSSGSAAMLELVRALGVLVRKGWQPRRTIIVASWDAGSFGAVGSTEWVEDHWEWLTKEAVAYIDVDAGVRGPYFFAEGSPTLKRLIYDVTSSVIAPNADGNQTIYDKWATFSNLTRESPSEKPPVDPPLSSGSDGTAFLSHAGISCLNFGFLGDYGVRYSAYDSFYWMSKFGDPTFEYHATLTKIWGLLTLRLASDRILPLYPKDYAAAIEQYIAALPVPDQQIADLYAPLHKPMKKLRKRSRKFEHKRAQLNVILEAYANRQDADIPGNMLKYLSRVNQRLMYFERGFANINSGLPGREWFKHVIYAPNLHASSPAVQVLPAIRDALESNNGTSTVQQAIALTAISIREAASILKREY